MAELIIRLIRVGELMAYVASAEYQWAPVVPISPQRAHSQAVNPRAQPADVALVLALDAAGSGQLVGYLGMVPDACYPTPATPQPERVGWMSCIWTDPAWRGRGVAAKLLGALQAAWPHQLLITEFTGAARSIYVKSGLFQFLPTSYGARGYLRFNLATLLPARWPRLGGWRPLLAAADAALNLPNALRLKLLHPAKNLLTVRYVDSAEDPALQEFLKLHQVLETCRRGPTELTWLLRHPWVLPAPLGPAADSVARRYQFTAVARQFQTVAFAVLADDAPGAPIVGFVVLTVRDGHLRVPYCYAAPEHLPAVARVVLAHAQRLGAAMMTVLQPALATYLRTHRTPFLLLREVRREYMITDELPTNFAVQDGDGDAAFT